MYYVCKYLDRLFDAYCWKGRYPIGNYVYIHAKLPNDYPKNELDVKKQKHVTAPILKPTYKQETWDFFLGGGGLTLLTK